MATVSQKEPWGSGGFRHSHYEVDQDGLEILVVLDDLLEPASEVYDVSGPLEVGPPFGMDRRLHLTLSAFGQYRLRRLWCSNRSNQEGHDCQQGRIACLSARLGKLVIQSTQCLASKPENINVALYEGRRRGRLWPSRHKPVKARSGNENFDIVVGEALKPLQVHDVGIEVRCIRYNVGADELVD